MLVERYELEVLNARPSWRHQFAYPWARHVLPSASYTRISLVSIPNRAGSKLSVTLATDSVQQLIPPHSFGATIHPVVAPFYAAILAIPVTDKPKRLKNKDGLRQSSFQGSARCELRKRKNCAYL